MYVSANVSPTAAGVSVSLVMFGCAWKPVVAIHITDLDFGLLTNYIPTSKKSDLHITDLDFGCLTPIHSSITGVIF